jgi:hypothetical protein
MSFCCSSFLESKLISFDRNSSVHDCDDFNSPTWSQHDRASTRCSCNASRVALPVDSMDALLPPELLSQVLRWSLHAHDDSAVHAFEGGFGDGKNPATRRLIEQILFTRRFVPTYLAVLGILVLLFSVGHWWTKLTRRRSRGDEVKEQEIDGSPASSSSSSTLQGTPSPKIVGSPKLEVLETTRLLSQPGDLPTRPSTTILTRLRCHLASTLAYQPSPIPALTSPSNTLPQNGTTLVLLLFLGLNLFYLLFHTPLSIPMLFVIADRAGLLFVVNLPVLYILAAKTNQPLKLVTGWSYEGLNIFHRRLGEWMIALGVVHSMGMFGVWYTLLRPLHFSLLRFLSTRLVLLGMFALSSYIAIWVTSTGYFRKLWYETFLGLHIFLQIAALVLLFFHHPGASLYVMASLGIWALDRLVGRMILSSKKFAATLQIAEDGETVLLFCDIPIRRGSAGSSLDISKGWKAGQHVFVTVPGIGWQHRLQTHPFTIASPAPPSQFSGIWPLQLTIRAQGGFSRELLEYAKLHQHTEINLDGPYGSLDALEALHNADNQFLIAGGSGIAVTYPLAWSLMVRDDDNALVSTRTTYRDGLKCIPSLRNEYKPSALSDSHVMHLWINQHSNHRKWLTMLPRKDALKHAPVFCGSAADVDVAWPENTIEVASLEPDTYSTRDSQDGHIGGRPDVALDLRRWIEDGREQACAEKICVVVSGPDGLVRDVRNAAARLVLEGWNVEVFVEKFGW